jgi:hypothetical protein
LAAFGFAVALLAPVHQIHSYVLLAQQSKTWRTFEASGMRQERSVSLSLTSSPFENWLPAIEGLG